MFVGGGHALKWAGHLAPFPTLLRNEHAAKTPDAFNQQNSGL